MSYSSLFPITSWIVGNRFFRRRQLTSRAVAEDGMCCADGFFNNGSSSTNWTLNGHGVATSNQNPIVVQIRPILYT